MSLINPALLFGLGLVAAPVLLHLLMRAKPKKLLFPALQLIQKRKMQNTRRMRLRHLWLLLLRVLVLAVLVAAMARPSLPAAEYSLTTGEWITAAGIAVVLLTAYFGFLFWWKRQRVSNHTLTTRRTFLRGGLGTMAVLLFAALVAWPYQKRIAAEISAPLPEVSSDLPAAAVFIFDTSASMEYRLEGRTRLDIAKQIAAEHLSSLPARSHVAVTDTSTSADFPFQADLAAAQGRIESLETRATAVPLNQRLRTALALQEDDRKRTMDTQEGVAETLRTDQLVREIYIFTDMSSSAWLESSGRFLTQELERLGWASVYLIDVGVDQHQNVALTNLQLSGESVAEGDDVVVSADVTSIGHEDQPVMVEFYVEGKKGTVKQDQRNVRLRDDSPQHVEFSLRDVKEGTTRGEFRLVSGDPLKADNTLRFSVLSRPNARVLVVSDSAELRANTKLADRLSACDRSDAAALLEVLELLNFECDFTNPVLLETKELARFDVVVMVNVEELKNAVWTQLGEWVKAGGGLSVILGTAQFGDRDGMFNSYNSEVAQEFLPAELFAPRKFLPKPSGLDVKNTSHPVLRKFDIAGAATEVGLVPVRRCWRVKPSEEANVIATYLEKSGLPALVERPFGEGRTVLLTTGVTPAFDPVKEWSGLARHWAFVVLTDHIVHYLSGRSQAVANYTAGTEVSVPLDRTVPVRRYLLRKPGGVQLPGEVPKDTTILRLNEIDEVGHYEVVAADPAQKFRSGFSVNLPLGESEFGRLSGADLDILLGEGRYAVAQNTESLTRTVNTGRLGMEVFPIILGLAVIVFCLELVVANRFYEADQDPFPEASTAGT